MDMDRSDIAPILELRGIRKAFPGTLAVDHVDLDLRSGEIHGLVGHNGAGKSTLMKIIAGALDMDRGAIRLRGQEVNFRSPRDAIDAGICMVYQELDLAPNLSGHANIFLGDNRYRTWPGLVRKKQEIRAASEVLTRLGVKDVDLKLRVDRLSLSNQQIIAIAKAISKNAQLIILDEPTSALNESEIRRLFLVMQRLKKENVAIVFITHRLDEIFEVADRVTVMRNGTVIVDSPIRETNRNQIVSAIAAREVLSARRDEAEKSLSTRVVLKVENLQVGDSVHGVGFSLRSGEVLGITGLMGCGAIDVAGALFGAIKHTSGTIWHDGQEVAYPTPVSSVKRGIGFVPHDRKAQGLVLTSSVRNNITLPIVRKLCHFMLVRRAAESRLLESAVRQLSIKLSKLGQRASTLSGGNQQKVVFAKWLTERRDLLILCEPTRGIDIGTKSEIERMIRQLATGGMAIIVVSYEIEEILNTCDRVLVLYEGNVARELSGRTLSKDQVVEAMYGGEARTLPQG